MKGVMRDFDRKKHEEFAEVMGVSFEEYLLRLLMWAYTRELLVRKWGDDGLPVTFEIATNRAGRREMARELERVHKKVDRMPEFS